MLYIMADTHLSGGCDKPMDVFGSRWSGYTEKIVSNWNAVVHDDDTVVIPGDISWGMNFEQALPDFALLHSLPGQKLIGKGNHDYWWQTMKKMTAFFDENGFSSLHPLFNNAYRVGNIIVCGCRGWYTEEKKIVLQNDADSALIVAREKGRLQRSLEEGAALRDRALREEGVLCELIAVMHFPPVFTDYICRPLTECLARYGVSRCYFGHIHGTYNIAPLRVYEGITYRIVSADYLDFHPFPVEERQLTPPKNEQS